MGREKYEGNPPGHLKLSVISKFFGEKYLKMKDFRFQIRCVRGVLEVYVQSAQKLFGRRSQDPYALVYLLDKEKGAGESHAKTWFQENNMKTRTEDKTLDPLWNHRFEFAGVSDLGKKSLVVAIWDKDSRTRDDYMAGVRIPMEEVQFFDARKGEVKLELQHQMPDGHVSRIQEIGSFLF